MKNDMDMLHGSIGDKLMKFALPLAATGILQQLFNAADVAVVGNWVGKKAMAAVGCNTPVITLILSLFTGISIGANVVISTLIGQKRHERVKSAVHTAILFAFVGGVIFAGICELLSRQILSKMSIPDNVFEMALLYFRVYIAGMPVILLYDFCSAVFRSYGNTRTPLICLMTSGVINVLLNLFFVIVLKMTVNGVALATVISNLISSVLLIYFLMKEKSEIHFSPSQLRIDKKQLASMVAIGLPAGLQGMVFAISNILIQSSINKLGSDVMAASSAAFNIEIFAYYILNSFGQGATTFVGQNYGAKNPERCIRATKIAMAQDMVITVVMSLLILLVGRHLLHIFNPDPEVVRIGSIRLKYILLSEGINVVIEILSGCMRGYGRSIVPALICTAGICGVRITWVYTAFRHSQTFSTLLIAYPLSWAATGTALVIAYTILRRHTMKPFFQESKL
ncbi:MATE family efflux transporter [Ruminococcus sp.]|uniref:MATE family efflux transporter n=1 Tax=Ruminococcus sp. TaxID=41978 RepID=UPI0025FC8184|nr:MATE family efflux transporter [Ruminococcus sp.]MBQ8965494.1 MATE family efflux transporter [Ruminococcus sp.]